MKTFTKILVVLCIIFVATLSRAQNNKMLYGLVNEFGEVLSPVGATVGWVTKDGIIKDSAGQVVANVNSEGEVIEAKTKRAVGKLQRNGNYMPNSAKSQELGLTVLDPLYGTCEVKNAKGETVIVLHEQYKHYGAAAYHFLYMRKQEKIIVKSIE